MKHVDQIRRLFDRAAVRTNVASDDAAFETIRTAYTRAVQRKAAQREPTMWRFFRKNPSARLAVAAAILMAFGIGFSTGRWSKPTQGTPHALLVTGYPSPLPVHPTTPTPGDSFWRQKALAAMQPRPYAQIQTTESTVLNIYKPYRKGRHND